MRKIEQISKSFSKHLLLRTWGGEYGLTHELPEVQMNFMSTHNVPVPKFQ